MSESKNTKKIESKDAAEDDQYSLNDIMDEYESEDELPPISLTEKSSSKKPSSSPFNLTAKEIDNKRAERIELV